MSTNDKHNVHDRSAAKPPKQNTLRRPMGGHGPGGLGRPVEKAKDFKGTLKRLLKYLKPYRINLVIVFIFTIAGTIFAIASPRVQANAINKLTDGYMARTVLKEMTKMQKQFITQGQRPEQETGKSQDFIDVGIYREFAALPMLDTVDDPGQKADITHCIIN
jgi:ATP-binding cassette subfamily B multidrug efflux pump